MTLLFYNVRVLISALGYIFHYCYVISNLQIILSKIIQRYMYNSTCTSNKFTHCHFQPSNLIIGARINQRIRVYIYEISQFLNKIERNDVN